MTQAVFVDGTPTDGTNPWIDSLVWGGAWRSGDNGHDSDNGPVEIEVAISEGFFFPNTFAFGAEWFDYEVAALRTAFRAFEAVADVRFTQADDEDDADITYHLSSDATFRRLFDGRNVLATHDAPAYPEFDEDEYFGIFNYDGAGWTEEGLTVGGFGFRTLLHEIGHGLGLAHPFGGGTADDATSFPGVSSAFGDFGDFGLNQGVYTIMSFNDPLEGSESSSEAFGWVSGPMALDIRALQLLYGANMSHATGDDVYRLPQTNGAGTFWSSIWDAGGTDTISAEGSMTGVTIHLDDADLTGEFSGGRISQVDGVMGGFTIANGVQIENAIGGDGNDTLFGDEFDNVLEGRGGSDALFGGGGNDWLDGGSGDDLLYGGTGDDTYVITSGDSIFETAGEGDDTVICMMNEVWLPENVENLIFDDSVTGYLMIHGNDLANELFAGVRGAMIEGGDGDDVLTGDLEADDLRGGDGNDTLLGLAGNDRLRGDNGSDRLEGDSGDDTLEGGNNNDYLDGDSGADDLDGGAGNDTLLGGTGDDLLSGGRGNDELDGGASDDVLRGDSGNDELFGNTGSDSLDGGTGNDVLNGGSDSDVLIGGRGRDFLDGGTGSDDMRGGVGNDTYVVDNTSDVIVEVGGDRGGTDTVISRLAFYTLANRVENLEFEFDSTPSSVTGIGNGLGNRMEGVAGVGTTLEGLGGNDRLLGASGDDVLDGGAGRDRIEGKKGDDVLTGGAGEDTFFFRKGDGSDTITDFNANADEIVIGKGANKFGQLDIEQVGSSVEVSFKNVTITLLNTDIADITRDVFDL